MTPAVMVFLADCTHGEIAQESDQQQGAHDVHGHRIRLRLGYAAVDLVLPYVIHQYRAQDACGRPGGQQPAVNGADVMVPNTSRRYAGMVAKPPPYMERMMQKAATNSGIEPRWPSVGTVEYSRMPSRKNTM